jgi:hypothetical protein
MEQWQEQIEKRLEKVEQQQTEPIQITVERKYPDSELLREISAKQDTQEKQFNVISADISEIKIDTKAYTGDAAIFKNKVERVEGDMSTVTSDIATLKSHVSILKGDVGTLKTDMEQVKTVQNGHSKYFEEHGRRLSQIETDISGLKTDVSGLQTDVTSIKSTLVEQSEMLKRILAKLP